MRIFRYLMNPCAPPDSPAGGHCSEIGPASFHRASAGSVGSSFTSQIFVPLSMTVSCGPFAVICRRFQSSFLRRPGNFSSPLSSHNTLPRIAPGALPVHDDADELTGLAPSDVDLVAGAERHAAVVEAGLVLAGVLLLLADQFSRALRPGLGEHELEVEIEVLVLLVGDEAAAAGPLAANEHPVLQLPLRRRRRRRVPRRRVRRRPSSRSDPCR